MDNVINWGLLKHPMNWAIVLLMVLIASAGLHFVFQYAGKTE